jgi:hypothetical protein
MSGNAEPGPELERRKVRTALWLGLLAVAFVFAFVLKIWLR